MAQVLILADDLTGAADCGVAFARSGVSTVLFVGDNAGDLDADVLSVDCDTRGSDPRQAADKTELLLRGYLRDGQIIFKKLDSTLRGNVAEELSAVLRAQRTLVPHAVAIFAPAFPALGRTTLDGTQLLHGKPLEESEIWQREGKRRRSYIPHIVCEAGLRCELIPLPTVRSDRGSLRTAMKMLAETTDVLVCDATTDEDLRAIAEATMSLESGTVWAGSAGLAYHLPEACGAVSSPPRTIGEQFASGPTLFVVGSPARTSQEQARVLAESGITEVTIHPSDLVAGDLEKYERPISEILLSSHDVLVRLDTIEAAMTSPRHLCRMLADILVPHANTVGALVVTGGETARTILEAWGVGALRIAQEVETGVPFCVTGKWRRRLPVITKAGDFGSPQTLLHCRDFLNALDRASSEKEL